MSASLGQTPALDHALARVMDQAPLRGVPVALARGIAPPAAAVLAARLRHAGADVLDGVGAGPCYVLGVLDEDLTGHRGATSQLPGFAQDVPVVDLSQSPLMRLVHDHIGIGQASVMALLDITNLQLAGRHVVVCGYGPTGAGVAAHAAALGARVTVVERDALRAAKALGQGHSVERFASVLPRAEVIFATGEGPDLGQEQTRHLASGVILAVAGMQHSTALADIARGRSRRSVRAHVEAFDLPDATDLKLIAGGQPLHLAGGQGLPHGVQDIMLALHVLALGQLLRAGPGSAGSVPLDPALEAGLAACVVTHMGGQLEAQAGR
ncbi:adenosylhomocysteinase [Jannaschia sp. CCS1]|uniref:adenosylhomocysteinase n=1 Tax=Jannaschia sp. (strain CCS1) TaxID=290400 RepID=UPI000053BD64|nr:adenosylhomocysteinase [Jannaschia sp. CCS1]ABD54497.1 adenosylhomocysteinase [Jannaschia sp. CCS1]